MPAWPVRVQAAAFTDADAPPAALLAMMADGRVRVFNYTGEAGPCFNTTSADPPGVQGNGWDIQCCAEVAQPIGSYGLPNDFFLPAPFSLDGFIAGCKQRYNTVPRPYWILQQYGLNLTGASNIVFSNGRLDPWIAGGIVANVTGAPSVIAIVIDEGAHHADLRAADPADRPSCRLASWSARPLHAGSPSTAGRRLPRHGLELRFVS